MNTFTINEKEYKSKEFDFNLVCHGGCRANQ